MLARHCNMLTLVQCFLLFILAIISWKVAYSVISFETLQTFEVVQIHLHDEGIYSSAP